GIWVATKSRAATRHRNCAGCSTAVRIWSSRYSSRDCCKKRVRQTQHLSCCYCVGPVYSTVRTGVLKQLDCSPKEHVHALFLSGNDAGRNPEFAGRWVQSFRHEWYANVPRRCRCLEP